MTKRNVAMLLRIKAQEEGARRMSEAYARQAAQRKERGAAYDLAEYFKGKADGLAEATRVMTSSTKRDRAS